ncbi:MAG: hypothetical protein KIT62_06675 [Cyclobacteriaceae bacterium]|nr:hypothetical protein [Cyclobacteriaceae bacterium]
MWALIIGLFSFTTQEVAADTLRPALDTTANRVVTVNRILVIGNKITREKIISRELSLKVGDTVSTHRLKELVKRDQQKIYNLRLFNKVELRWFSIDNHHIDLLVDVAERWYTFPVPIFELSDRNFNEWWQNYNHDFRRVNYGVRLYQYNSRGRNETLRLTAQFGFTRRFELTYRIPYIDQKQKHGLIFDFNYIEPRNMAYFTDDHKLVFRKDTRPLQASFQSGISYTYRKNFYQTHTFQYHYQDNRVSDSIVHFNPNYFGANSTRQSFSSLRYFFNADHRDVFAYPLKGYQFLAMASKSGLGFGRVNLWELSASYARFLDLDKGYYLSNYSAFYLSSPDNQPYNLYSALGYRRQLVKGYEVYVIEGPRYVLNKTTLRKKIFSRTWQLDNVSIEQFRHFPLAIYLKGYLDLGYVENYPYYEQLGINSRLSNRLLAGTGTGLDIVTAYDAILRLEYTFTREKTHGFFLHMKKEF